MFNNSNVYLQYVVAFLATAFTIIQGIDWLLQKFEVEGNYTPALLIILLISFFVGLYILRKNKIRAAEDADQRKSVGKTNRKILPYLNVGVTLVLAAFFAYYFMQGQDDKDLLDVKLPEIMAAYEADDMAMVYRETKRLLDEENTNPIVRSYFDKVTEEVSVYTEPSDVQVSFQLRSDTTDNWESIGVSPIGDIRLPYQWVKLKFSLDGAEYIENAHPFFLNMGSKASNVFILPTSDEIPEGHQLFLGGRKKLSFPGIDHLPDVKLGPYSMARQEVTNVEYKAFVDAGGYLEPEYWDFPALAGGAPLLFEVVARKFTDKLGQPGPANWSYGEFPEGQADFPVTGISWYEARAFARYAEMQLPNLYQWANAATLRDASKFVPKSNFSKNQLTPVGTKDNANSYNMLDIAGNVREWVINSVDDAEHKKAILGGAFTDDPYFFNDFYGQDAMDRTIGNGLRLAKSLEYNGTDISEPIGEIKLKTRDFLSETKVSDDVFEVFKAQFDYPEKDLNEKVIPVSVTSGKYKAERFEISSAYEENGVLPGYVFYDSTRTSPFKPIIYFPGSNAIHLTNTEQMIKGNMKRMSYLLQEGYAVFQPIYLSTYERADEIKSDYPNESDAYKEHAIKWGKDYRRTIDYIASREDMDMEHLSYYGISWGGFMANTLLAIDDRVKNSVLYVAGLCFQRSKNEVEAYHYTSRITIPVLMLNGKFDQFFPLETSQNPMYELLATPEEDKKHYVFETGHFVPNEELIKEHLAWLKKYE